MESGTMDGGGAMVPRPAGADDGRDAIAAESAIYCTALTFARLAPQSQYTWCNARVGVVQRCV